MSVQSSDAAVACRSGSRTVGPSGARSTQPRWRRQRSATTQTQWNRCDRLPRQQRHPRSAAEQLPAPLPLLLVSCTIHTTRLLPLLTLSLTIRPTTRITTYSTSSFSSSSNNSRSLMRTMMTWMITRRTISPSTEAAAAAAVAVVLMRTSAAQMALVTT